MKALKTVFLLLLILCLTLLAVFLIGRYGWKIGAFRSCQSAGIEDIRVEADCVRIRGFDPGSFPRGFLGYYARQVEDTLYIGFRFSGLFGIFETGDFDITVPTEGTVTKIVVKTADNEYLLWPEET